ncbi:glycosyltransferase family 4 protein [Kordiimonas sp.]|uniref:glycosyltransferase family 4 protein n=1 Tax=Kordiimonas sp. TaxID=1970157 RepID=UPI003A93C80F
MTKVLWFSPTPSLYGQNTVRHNGGGWVASLERIVRTAEDIDLGIAFEHGDTHFKSVQDGVNYYPIHANSQRIQKLRRKLGLADECEALIQQAHKIVADFKPDLIHVFGSEGCFGLLSSLTDVPVLIHMQGSLPSYVNARFPPGYGRVDFLRAAGFNPMRLYRALANDASFVRRARREESILRNCRHFMGRTEWDKAICQIYSPDATYDYCGEALRPDFYSERQPWKPQGGARLNLVSTLSNPLYKGADMVLKTARLLREEMGRALRWQVFGISEAPLQEAKVGRTASDLGVEFMSVAPAADIRNALLEADIYVHTSYIDNSPNSLCEAQILGLPVVAANVGGVASLIEHGNNGFLVPANDPWMMASRIAEIKDSPSLSENLGEAAFGTARDRHDPERILSDLLTIYGKYATAQGRNNF